MSNITIEWTKPKPKAPIIIEGFPGFGFVSTIATEYLIRHLGAKPIGRISSEKLLPIAAIHKSEVIYPLEIFYDPKNNIIILQAITQVEGLEWFLAESVIVLAKEVNAKEIISLEGVIGKEEKEPEIFYYTTQQAKRKLLEKISKPLEEGIILGVTGALLMKVKEIPFSCFFVEAHPGFPDNRAAAKLIQALDSYLNLKVDYKPLLEKAKELEERIKTLVSSLTKAKALKEKKFLSYTG